MLHAISRCMPHCCPSHALYSKHKSHPLFSPDRLEVEELEEVVLDEPGAAQQQALYLLEVDVPYNGLLDGPSQEKTQEQKAGERE